MMPPSPIIRISGACAVVGALALGLGFVLATDATFRAWLAADLVVLGLSLGALLILAIHDLTQGSWGETLRAVLEPMAAALPVPVVGMIVPLLGMPVIFGWTSGDPSSLPETLRHKLLYLDPLFITARTAAIAILWLAIAFAFELFGPWRFGGRRAVATVALIVFAVTITVFSTDWMVALDPRFYSTIYPMLEASGEIVGAFAVGIIALFLTGLLQRPVESSPRVLVSEDIANLFLGFVLLWIYLAFMQWLVVWSGDLPEEGGWYVERTTGAWRFLLWLIVALQGVLPVACLLNRRLKRTPVLLAAVAGATLIGHILDVVWRILPAFSDRQAATAGLTFAAFAAIGGAWTFFAIWMASRPFIEAREVGNA